MKVLKFGGSSIGSPERIKSVIDILRNYPKGKITVVFSAFGGTTDKLIHMSDVALKGDKAYQSALSDLESTHLDVLRALVSIKRQSSLVADMKIMFNELSDILHGVYLLKERSARTLDFIMSFGERLSNQIIVAAMNEAGLDAEYVDARAIIQTDHEFGRAVVDFEVTNTKIQQHFKQHERLQVVTGFIASTGTGETTTLGRSGSDYTAAILAGALEASDLEIWTDVDGMMTADPRMVKKAFTIPELSYEEAMELSHFGAKVIFPSAMRPAMRLGIPIWVKNTFNPGHTGTRISGDGANGKLIKGISSINNISLLNIQGSGMIGIAGISMRLFSCLAQEKINVILISQASSEHSICVAIESSQAKLAERASSKEFRNEIAQGQMDKIIITNKLSIVAVVGDGMKHHVGTSGRMFYSLGRNGVNIVAIAQGSSERNISVVIDEENVRKSLSALHDSFFLSKTKTINLFVAGTGLIGSTLMKQMATQYNKLLEENHLDIQLIGVTNSRKMQFNEEGLDFLNTEVKLKTGEKSDLSKFKNKILELNLPNSIFVDCTASEKVSELYGDLLAANVSVVTPNKKANSGPLETYSHLKRTATAQGSRFFYETNVGAGLPVINTINDLLLSGDNIIRIEAVLSGTLNFIFSSFIQGTAFSDVVREAKAKGFTEPDPRDDLNGTDVARKILILAREAGSTTELNEIAIESLVPDDCEGELSMEDFFSRLKTHDNHYNQMLESSDARNERLRYQAVYENGEISVGLKPVASDHPFYSLSGSDNMILLTTERYNERPMVIRGPGAGAEVTAAGVFADVIRIGNYVRL